MNKTPRANRTHIAIFGMRNAGKSSVINALTNQQISLVSDFAGTTTDPVFKSMEILPLGPVVLIDTAGRMPNNSNLMNELFKVKNVIITDRNSYLKAKKIYKKDILVNSLKEFDEILLIGSGKGVASVQTINQIKWKRKSLKFYNILSQHYKSAVNKCAKYR